MTIEQLILAVGVIGLLTATFDGLRRTLVVGVGALLVLAYPFVEAHSLADQVPWTAVLDSKPDIALVDATVRVAIAFLVPYILVRTLFAFARSWGD